MNGLLALRMFRMVESLILSHENYIFGNDTKGHCVSWISPDGMTFYMAEYIEGLRRATIWSHHKSVVYEVNMYTHAFVLPSGFYDGDMPF